MTGSGSRARFELFRLFDRYDLSWSASVRSASQPAFTDRFANHSREGFEALRGVGGFSRAVLGVSVAGYAGSPNLGLAKELLKDYI